MGELVVERGHRLAPVAFREVEKREVGERDGLIALQRMVFLLVSLDEPAAVEAGLEEAVAVGDVVAVDLLDCQARALHVRRVRVEVRPVDAREVASSVKEDLAVVPWQLPHPGQQGEAVRALALVGDPVALAQAAAAAVLREVGVAAREFVALPLREGGQVDGLFRHVGGAHDHDRTLHARRRTHPVRVELHAVWHWHHLLEGVGWQRFGARSRQSDYGCQKQREKTKVWCFHAASLSKLVRSANHHVCANCCYGNLGARDYSNAANCATMQDAWRT